MSSSPSAKSCSWSWRKRKICVQSSRLSRWKRSLFLGEGLERSVGSVARGDLVAGGDLVVAGVCSWSLLLLWTFALASRSGFLVLQAFLLQLALWPPRPSSLVLFGGYVVLGLLLWLWEGRLVLELVRLLW
jgi:hypothetical protein